MLERNRVLPHRISELAGTRPDLQAIVDVSGSSLTYPELRDAMLLWAGAYRRHGLSAGQTVVTMLPNSIDAYLAWLGAAWLGAIEVPANNGYRGHMLHYLVENSEAEVLLISERFVDRLALVADELTRLKTVIVPDASAGLADLPFRVVAGADFLRGAEPATDVSGPDYRELSSLIYTSGTTGPSKGVQVPWAELCWFSDGVPEDLLDRSGAYYSPYPVFHLSGKSALYITALREASLVIRESFSPGVFWDDIRAHDVHTLALLGPMAAMLLQMPARENDADNPADRMMMGPIIPGLEEFKRRFGIDRVSTGFGMTEVGLPITAGWNPPNTRTCGQLRRGRPGYEVRVVDEHDEEVPTGEVGELVVRASEPWVMNTGYWRLPDKTAEAWRNGWFHTGDGFRVDEDGWFYFVDRVKDAIRRRGENISSLEVEAEINQHPAVRESAVVAVASEFGEDDVMAVIVLHAGEELEPEALIEYLTPRMPRFMIPRYLEFVEALPKTEATLRIQKVKLRAEGATPSTWDRERSGSTLPK
jgi:crotonobetaine/carnitine-CoA ligase